MQIIKKARESMTSRDRVMAAFAHAKVDRLPIDYHTNAGIDAPEVGLGDRQGR